jgi:aryl-phospho-beta-D-glucosidase BglC (GH1 family)
MKKRSILCVAAALICLAAVRCTTAPKDFLRVEGQRIVNDGGEVLLRGMGLGGWVLQEPYMLRLPSGMRNQSQFRDSLVSLVGEERTAEFYRAWWRNGIQKRDIDSLAAWGFNHVRMPMHYNLYTLPIDKEPVPGEQTWLTEGFAITDSLLAWCAANRIYLFLDLHAAPGGQGNDVAISDASPVKLWQDERNVEKSVALWRKLAERYRDEEWIGGYDIINEPNWGFTDPEGDPNGTGEQNNAPLHDYLVRVTRAIREVDTNHIVVIEGNGWGNNYNGVWPLDWDSNTVISFHRYWIPNTQDTIERFLTMRKEQNAPLWMSESGENSNEWFTEAVALLESNNIGWCWWTYKRLGSGTPMEITPGDGYLRLLDYWRGEAEKPSPDEAWVALQTLAENYKQENTTFHRDYIDALFTSPDTK